MGEVIKIWVPLIGFLSSIILGVFVLRQNPKSWVFRTYSLYALYLALLNLGFLGFGSLKALGLVLLPLGFFQFVLSLTSRFTPTNRIILAIGYLTGLIFLVWPGKIELYNFFYNLLFGGFFIYSAYFLYLRSKATFNPFEINRIAYLTLALWMGLFKLLIDICDSFGWNLSPFWNFTIVFQPFIMAYAIARAKPMSLASVLRKITTYSVFSIWVILSYFLIQTIFMDFLRIVSDIADPELTFFSSLLTALTLVILVQSLGDHAVSFIEQLLFHRFYRRWSSIKRLSQTLSQVFDQEIFLGTVLNVVTNLTDVQKSSILLWNRKLKRFEMQFAFGLSGEVRRKAHFSKESALIKWQQKNSHPLLIEEVEDDPLFEGAREEILNDLKKIEGRASFPLVVNESLIGLLILGDKRSGEPYFWEEVKLVSNLCNQISGALISMSYYDQKIKEYLSIIQAFAFSMEAKDKKTQEHCERVAKYAMAIGQRMGLPLDVVESLKLGGMIHDIGKVTISDEILLKPGTLTDEEFEEVKKHTQAGLKILVPIQFSKEVVDSVLSHHERLSGKGYPEALKGDEIPLVARIMAVADVYDAMSSDRQYRKALSTDEAKLELLRGAGKEYDPEVVQVFLSILEERSGRFIDSTRSVDSP
ncbi:TPA: hypothetical protein DCX15_02590 [bacterium]|nr:hypothetical protein [bacterium]